MCEYEMLYGSNDLVFGYLRLYNTQKKKDDQSEMIIDDQESLSIIG